MPGRTLSPWNQSIVWACDGLASPGSNAPVEVSSTMIMHSFSILNKELTLSADPSHSRKTWFYSHRLLSLVPGFRMQRGWSRNDICKHCKRRNGPEGWVQLAKVTCLGHITSSSTNLDQISSSEFRPNNNFKISTKRLMSTDCPDDMLSENITKDTMSSLQGPLSKNPNQIA